MSFGLKFGFISCLAVLMERLLLFSCGCKNICQNEMPGARFGNTFKIIVNRTFGLFIEAEF